ncbi:MAG: YjcQ family protein [Lachnospiraceae bacterium]|nr:YjcQ family protein [Lachnospiraceae bacterium]
MDNFSVIYKILKALEKAMDYDEFDTKLISHERFGISYQRWEKILIMLVKSGYIEGVAFDQTLSDYSQCIVEPIHPVITLKGLEYLSENTLMKKAANLARGIKETIPGL